MLPVELLPDATTTVPLPGGKSILLPVCHPVFQPWTGAPLKVGFGRKPVIDYAGEACFAEIAILRMLLKDGWYGVWVSSYGGVRYFTKMPTSWAPPPSQQAALPFDKRTKLERIRQVSGTQACFDVFAWKDSEILFCEAKHYGSGDSATDGQVRFITGALECGVKSEALLVAEWSFVGERRG